MTTKTKAKPKAAKKPHAGRNGAVGKAAPPAAEVLTLDEAAALLRVGPNEFRADVESGLVPGRRVTGQWRFSSTALVAWLAGTPSHPLTKAERLRIILDTPPPDETEEEYQAYMASIEAFRDEVNRATGSGKYAPK